MATENVLISIDEKGAVTVARNIENIGKSTESAATGVGVLKTALAALMAVMSFNVFKEFSSTWVQLKSQVDGFTSSMRETNSVMDRLYDNYVTLQGFQADNAWGFGDATIGETRMGVDGKQSGGYTPHETPWTLHLEANSPSIEVMENIRKDFNSNMETRLIDIVVEIRAIKKRYGGSGFMTTLTGGAAGQKLLNGSQYNFNLVVEGAEGMN